MSTLDDKKQYDWYYYLSKPDEYFTDYDIYEVPTIYSKLAQRIAYKLFDNLYTHMIDFVHKEKSPFYGDIPTIWDQLKSDEKHGDPPINEYQIEVECAAYLDTLKQYELELLWIYACDTSDDWNISIYNAGPEEADYKFDIFRRIINDLYHDAEQENLED